MRSRGFTLVEMMLCVLILSIIVLGIHRFFQNYLDAFLGEKGLSELQGDAKLALSVTQQDIKTACFGMPPAIRAASHDEGGVIIDGATTDRLFLANGWEILRDFTDNGWEDGVISDPSYAKIASRKGQHNTGGYAGSLTARVNEGDGAITLKHLNINSEDEVNTDNDFRNGESLILYDGVGSIEGHRICSIQGNTINFVMGESLANDYPQGSTQVVPAICYYIATIKGRWWLCRNESRMLKGVEDFQVRYGYDNNNDGRIAPNEWVDDIPPNFDPNLLMCARVRIVVNFEHERRFERGERSHYTYEITGAFRN